MNLIGRVRAKKGVEPETGTQMNMLLETLLVCQCLVLVIDF